MSKVKKIGINCPQCSSALFVKAARHKVACHPMYVKKGKLVINYSRSSYTETRVSRFWLWCLNPDCTYQRSFEKEEDMIAEAGHLAYDQFEALAQPSHHEKKQKQSAKETLPVIVRPSQMELEDEEPY